MDTHYDAIVIGAGPGGSSCAALLAQSGLKILLIEKNNRIGGKAITVSREGFRYELWPIIGGPATRFQMLFDRLGIPKFYDTNKIGHTLHYRRKNSNEYRSHLVGESDSESMDSPGNKMMHLIDQLELDKNEVDEIIKMYEFMTTLCQNNAAELEDASISDIFARYKLPVSFLSYIGAYFNIAFVLPLDQISATEAIKTFVDLLNGGGYYPRGGYGTTFEKVNQAFQMLGGTTKLKTRIQNILVENGQVKGVKTDNDIFYSQIVVSNAGLQPTILKLVDEHQFSKEYINYIKNLVPSLGLIGGRYFLNKKRVLGAAHIGVSDKSICTTNQLKAMENGKIPEDVVMFVTVPSNIDPSLSPDGKQCVLAATLCPPDPQLDNEKDWYKKVDEMMEKLFPEIMSCIERKEYYGPKQVSILTRDAVLPGIGGECIGLGQTIRQCGVKKPACISSIHGLFFVGCDSGGYGCGTHQAVDSAFNVSQMVQMYHKTHCSNNRID